MHKIQEILDVATIKPAVLQVEINPYWNQHELKEQLKAQNITFEGWYPLGPVSYTHLDVYKRQVL